MSRKLKFSKELTNQSKASSLDLRPVSTLEVGREGGVAEFEVGNEDLQANDKGNFVYRLVIFPFIAVLILGLIISGHFDIYSSDVQNFGSTRSKKLLPNRGVIVDKNGVILAENVPSMNLYIDSEIFQRLEEQERDEVLVLLQEKLNGKWEDYDQEGNGLYESLKEKYEFLYSDQRWFVQLKLASGLENDMAIELKAIADEYEFLIVDDHNVRNYPYGQLTSHLLGYSSNISAEDIESLDYLSIENQDETVGKLGLERFYDALLRGENGYAIEERNARGELVSDGFRVVDEKIEGANLQLNLDIVAQQKMYEILEKAVQEYEADGASGIIQRIDDGGIEVIANYPSYDNNPFVSGISIGEYAKIRENPNRPLVDRALGAQLPPGSIFKTLTAAVGLQSGVIDSDTTYLSRDGYAFSNDVIFPEINNNSYGNLNVVDALSVSSNIFFCEVMRNGLEIDEFSGYLDKFGIGKTTGIDTFSEASGMLPSRANKESLALNRAWLDPIWYPEGDSCNTAIGQGITTITPIQAVNWVSTLNNGGKVFEPSLVQASFDGELGDESRELSPTVVNKDFIDQQNLETVIEGMRYAVERERLGIYPLKDTKYGVGAKTGTAEFGRIDPETGYYEQQHGWVVGFFPAQEPKYSFVILLENGKRGLNAAITAKEFLDWHYGYVQVLDGSDPNVEFDLEVDEGAPEDTL